MVHGKGLLAHISSLSWRIGYLSRHDILVSSLPLKSVTHVTKASHSRMSWMILKLYVAIFTGLFGLAFISIQDVSMLTSMGINVVSENGIQVLEDPEKIFIAFSQILFNPFVSGILLAAILAAIMSTIDSQLLVSSSAVAEDFYKSIFRRKATDKELITVGRIATLVIAIIAAIIAINPESNVLELVSYAWAGFGASFGPIILLSLFWRRITRNGALTGIVVGALTVIIWGGFLSGGIFDLYEILPGFIFNMIITVTVSLTSKQSTEMDKEFDKTLTELKKK